MKKREVDHVLRAAGRITGEKDFIIIGSQALHGKYPDLADDIEHSAEVDLFAKNHPEKTESLNAIGVYSPFRESYGPELKRLRSIGRGDEPLRTSPPSSGRPT